MDKKLWYYLSAGVLVLALFIGIGSVVLGIQTVGICFSGDTSPDALASRQALEKALEDAGYQLETVREGTQTEQVQTLLEKDCSFLLLEPEDNADLESLSQLLGNTPTLFFGSNTPDNPPEGSICVPAPQETAGAMLAQLIQMLPRSGDLNGDGITVYGVIAGPQDNLADSSLLKTMESTLGEGAQQLTLCFGDGTTASGRSLCQEELGRYGKDLELIVCTREAYISGALEAITERGRTVGQDIYLISVGGSGAVLEKVTDGSLSGAVYGNWDDRAQMLLSTLSAFLSGEEVPVTGSLFQIVTPD